MSLFGLGGISLRESESFLTFSHKSAATSPMLTDIFLCCDVKTPRLKWLIDHSEMEVIQSYPAESGLKRRSAPEIGVKAAINGLHWKTRSVIMYIDHVHWQMIHRRRMELSHFRLMCAVFKGITREAFSSFIYLFFKQSWKWQWKQFKLNQSFWFEWKKRRHTSLTFIIHVPLPFVVKVSSLKQCSQKRSLLTQWDKRLCFCPWDSFIMQLIKLAHFFPNVRTQN